MIAPCLNWIPCELAFPLVGPCRLLYLGVSFQITSVVPCGHLFHGAWRTTVVEGACPIAIRVQYTGMRDRQPWCHLTKCDSEPGESISRIRGMSPLLKQSSCVCSHHLFSLPRLTRLWNRPKKPGRKL